MSDRIALTRFQSVRTRLHLFQVGVRKRLTVGVRAVLLEGRKVLLIKHTYLPGWQFPGGGVEPGETAEMSAAREVMEETGYATDGRPALHGFYLNRIARGTMWRFISGGNFAGSTSSNRTSRSQSLAGLTWTHCPLMSNRARRGGFARFSTARSRIRSGNQATS